MRRSSPCSSLFGIVKRCRRSVANQALGLVVSLGSTESRPFATAASSSSDHYIIFGLGNKDAKYNGTRHNVGRDFVAHLARAWKAPLVHSGASCSYSDALVLDSTRVTLANPETYMNLSGRAVRALSDRLGVPHSNLIVVHDDLEIPIGQVKVRNSGSANGQNGIRDCLQVLGNNSPFVRIRVGISRPAAANADIGDYVLSPFTPEQREGLRRVDAVLPLVLRAHVSKGNANADDTAAVMRGVFNSNPNAAAVALDKLTGADQLKKKKQGKPWGPRDRAVDGEEVKSRDAAESAASASASASDSSPIAAVADSPSLSHAHSSSLSAMPLSAMHASLAPGLALPLLKTVPTAPTSASACAQVASKDTEVKSTGDDEKSGAAAAAHSIAATVSRAGGVAAESADSHVHVRATVA